ncbi:MAG: tributyrin esterase [Nitrososphaeria archaeon]|nr:tributyrin esterase [Nitrososphaeria archaeon]MDW7986564.1 tributyrin esterase [Nitrososphaerota archaeon]
MEYKIDASNKDLRTLNSEIKKAINNGALKIVIENASHLDGLAAGLKQGNIVVNGDVGDYTAALNDGASITINGNCKRFLADNMTKGTVIVNGNVGYGCGVYCYGGNIIVNGDAGDFLGTLNKGAVIIVTGDCGDSVGTYMVGGEIVILGDAGERIGDWIIRGSIFIGGEYRSLGHNCKEVPVESEDMRSLKNYFKSLGIHGDLKKMKKLIPISSRPFYGRR